MSGPKHFISVNFGNFENFSNFNRQIKCDFNKDKSLGAPKKLGMAFFLCIFR